MSDTDKASPDSYEKLATEAFGLLYNTIKRRDESMVTPEILRVARALCHTNGGTADALIHHSEPEYNGRNTDQVRLWDRRIVMAWVPYVGHATCAIGNLDTARQEEAERMVREEEADNLVGLSGMTNGPGLGDAPLKTEGAGFKIDSLSDSDLDAMVEFLASIFDQGPDGDTARCRQTGEPFVTVALAWKFGDTTANDQMAKKILIRDATKQIIEMAKPGQHTIYWRKWPDISGDKDGLRFYARVAFGP